MSEVIPIQEQLENIGLNEDNSIVIGSGILAALGVRPSNDTDLVVAATAFERLDESGRFQNSVSYNQPVLLLGPLEIRKAWGVLGKEQTLTDLSAQSVILDGVRYISLEFLLAVKMDWIAKDEARDKDVRDVQLIRQYMTDQQHDD